MSAREIQHICERIKKFGMLPKFTPQKYKMSFTIFYSHGGGCGRRCLDFHVFNHQNLSVATKMQTGNDHHSKLS